MKIFVIKKKFIFLFLTTLIVTLIICYCFYIYNSPSLAVDLCSTSLNDITKSDEKVAYLTFDDGPTTKATAKILDILKEENVKATFFVVGKHVKEHPELVKREYDEGHYIANHGYNHNNKLLYSNMEHFKEEVVNTDIEISKAIGVENYCSHIFRFPNGYMAPINKNEKKQAVKLLSNMNYTYIDWNCLNNDSMKKYNKYELLQNLKNTSKNKGTLVILMHDTKDVSNSSTALKDSIEYLKSDGYTFENFYNVFSF